MLGIKRRYIIVLLVTLAVVLACGIWGYSSFLSKNNIEQENENYIEVQSDNSIKINEKYEFTPIEYSQLYNQGYAKEDITKAEIYSMKSGVEKMTILETRGKIDNLIPWKTVIKTLNLDLRHDAQKLGMKKKDIKFFRKKNISEQCIVRIALMMLNKQYTLSELKAKVKSNKDVERIEKGEQK